MHPRHDRRGWYGSVEKRLLALPLYGRIVGVARYDPVVLMVASGDQLVTRLLRRFEVLEIPHAELVAVVVLPP